MIKRLLASLLAFLSFAVFAAVDANKGSAAELDAVKGIGPTISTRIIDERKKGDFKDWADFVSRVKGVGEASAAKMSDAGLTVNGKPFKAAAAAPAADKKAAKAEPAPAKGVDASAAKKAKPAASAPAAKK
jgi:competence protein ComEA